MSVELRDILKKKFDLSEQVEEILLKNMRKLSREERRIYFAEVTPRAGELKEYLKYCYEEGSPEQRKQMENWIVENMLARQGIPDIVDSWLMDSMGSLHIFQRMRQEAESRGIRLTNLVNFGGLSMVIVAVLVISGIVFYFLNR